MSNELTKRAYTPYWHKRLGNAHRLLIYLLTEYSFLHAPLASDIARNLGVTTRTALKYISALLHDGIVSYRTHGPLAYEYYVVESVLSELHFLDELEK